MAGKATDDNKVVGKIFHIPLGSCLILPGDSMHGEGYAGEKYGNRRMYFYICMDGYILSYTIIYGDQCGQFSDRFVAAKRWEN
jgi:hypothetical protein